MKIPEVDKDKLKAIEDARREKMKAELLAKKKAAEEA